MTGLLSLLAKGRPGGKTHKSSVDLDSERGVERGEPRAEMMWLFTALDRKEFPSAA